MATSDYTAPTTSTPHSKNLSPYSFQTPASRQAKRKSTRRPRRSTIEKPNSMFKQTKTIILTEYNNNIPQKNETKSSNPSPRNNSLILSHLEFKESNSNINDIQKVLVRTKLIEFSCENKGNKSLILSWLSNGWHLPKKNTNIYKCKINSYITCTTLSQCLNYTFQEFMNLEWTKKIYHTLMTQLTITQKALLFSMGCNKQNGTISGIQAVDWMVNNSMAKTRKEAVMLGTQMLNKEYLCDVNNRYDFSDNNYLHYFADDIINKEIFSNNNTAGLKERLYKHNEMMNTLVSMTLIDGFDKNNININSYINDIKKVFYIPLELDINNINNNKYICKIVDNISFDHWYECIQFILNEFWNEIYAQNIYNILIKHLNIVEKCKLMSIGMNTQTKKYRLKKYKNCFNGSNGINWLINSANFVNNISNAFELCNVFLDKGLMKQIDMNNNNKFDNNIFYVFDLKEIENQSTNSLYNKPLIKKFINEQHGKILQNLILMSMSSSLEIELLLDLSVAFYLPRRDDNKFISKFDNNLSFSNIIDLLHYILIEKFDKNYSQIIYRKLLQKLSITQSCKLFSIGIECKTRKKHFKKYKNCFIGSEACQFLISKGFCNNYYESVILGNKWLNKGYISCINNTQNNNILFENNNNSFYIFNDIEINKQCIIESYNNNINNNSNTNSKNNSVRMNNNKNILISPQSYKQNVNASPYTENIYESEENNIFFNDIDYNILSDNNSDIINENISNNNLNINNSNSDDDTFIEFEITRTDPIKITKSNSRNNLSVYSNIAVHNGYKSQYNIDMLGDIVVMDSDDSIMQNNSNKNKSNNNLLNTNNLSIDIMTSYTNNTPEPQIEFGMHSDYENSIENDNELMKQKSTNTRITHDVSTTDSDDNITQLTQLNDNTNVNESHTSQKLLLSNNNIENNNKLNIDMNSEEYITFDESKPYSNSTSTSSLNSQRSHSHSRYNTNDIVQFKHHIISDSLTFTNDIISNNNNENDINENEIGHFTHITDNNGTFNMSFPDNNFTPNQIGV